MTAAERKALIDAYEAQYLRRMQDDVARLQVALARAEARLATATRQKAAGELMTAAMDPATLRVLGLEPCHLEKPDAL
jgi:hypothetical protein